MWVLLGSFFTFSNFYRLESHSKKCVALANLLWNICKKLHPPLSSYGYWKCMFVDFLIGYVGPPNYAHYWVQSSYLHLKTWTKFFKHVSLWCLLLDPHQMTYQSYPYYKYAKLLNWFGIGHLPLSKVSFLSEVERGMHVFLLGGNDSVRLGH